MKKFKQHNWSIIQQAIFFPAYAKALAGRFTYRSFSTGRLLIFTFFLFTACPDPPETTDCGANQIEINGECECDDGYHWNEDETKCLMDTTSHNFVWEIDTLGISGTLRDVQIIDENNIWVVGEIETDSGKYGGAHWNGVSWELKKLKGPGISVQTVTPRGLWYFSEDNIWFASGSIYHWNGTETSMLWQRNINSDETVEKIWASSEDDIYFVGKEGTIVHYDGSSFTRMESGTDINLKDIWGVVDETTGKINIWVCGDDDNPDRSIVLTLDNGDWKTVYERYPDGGGNTIDNEFYFTPKTSTLWTTADSDSLWVAGGWGVYTLNDKFEPTAYTYIDIEDAVGYFSFPWKIRGNSENDILLACENSSIFHFNGISWHWYETFYTPNTRFISVDIQSDFAVLAGIDYTGFLSKAFVIKGYR